MAPGTEFARDFCAELSRVQKETFQNPRDITNCVMVNALVLQ